MTYCIIFSTAESQAQADKIATALLFARAASCIQTTPIKSTYHWKKKIEKSDEIQMLIKTRDALYQTVEKIIKENHSYKVPQIIKVQINDGLPDYLNWITKETQ